MLPFLEKTSVKFTQISLTLERDIANYDVDKMAVKVVLAMV